MNKPLIMALLLIISLQQTILLRSDPSTTILKYPLNHKVVTEGVYHSIIFSIFYDYDINWIFKNKNDNDY